MLWFRSLITGLSIPCLMLGLLFFAASLTPSLIPRDALVQGILGGIVVALGYLLGKTVGLIWWAADMPRLPRQFARLRNIVLIIVAVGLTVWILTFSLEWQNGLRSKMGLEPAEAQHIATILISATLTFAGAYVIGAIVATLFRWIRGRFYRFMPPRRANVLGAVTVVVILFVVTRDGILDGVVRGLDESYEAAQNLFDTAPPPPDKPNQAGSAASLIDWAAMGQPGRDFITSGPDAAAISAFTGKPALDPIRVYVGRADGETPEERAKLALAELKRLKAFERKVLVVTSPTGTGWMDPGSHDPVEYMHNGDIATVSAQYSYLQSPLALILETRTGLDQATALLEVVHSYWKTLPKDQRPRLYAHGLSLGAWSSMYATNLFRLIDDPIDGAFWAGPPFPSDLWHYVQTSRQPGSPWVLPTIGDGSVVRYASHYADASKAEADWNGMRIVFLQYSSDPIVFYDPLSLWRAPPWMNDPPAEDVSDHLTFIPIVTQFQLALDMALSFGAPPGHGHAYYAQDYVAPWAEVTAPGDWSADETERLKAHCNLGLQLGCANGDR
ncbi:alpha/beta-hydrolase family protein [Roseibium porphyridii]|uniref:Alpha/beta-hydrolase family protein n=1 Tax=Roseibium porphyridii TaxID=2866279 RepID=A0ABY8F6X5_9HYPH|nr:alpha/beta-hydrolase family protein [Roseibium sp. KMA01]WFE90981.1 alpha/beta-hydrolase family protein [Roseibium sp. KMA01]